MQLKVESTSQLFNILYDYAESREDDFNNFRIFINLEDKNNIKVTFNLGDSGTREAIHPAIYNWIYNNRNNINCEYFEIIIIGNSDDSISYSVENGKSILGFDEDDIKLNIYELIDGVKYLITFNSLYEKSPQFTPNGIRLKNDKKNRICPIVTRI